MVEIRNLYKSYKGFNVLNGLNMHINKGDVYGFLGRNGCGKTTTMNILCNIIPKDSGELILGKSEENGRRIKIGYLPETPALFNYMNGYEYLGYIAACCNFNGNAKQRILEVLEITGMLEGGKRRISGYSRGMNQRLGIAAAIFDRPELVILDEPTSALDPEGRAEVMNIIKNLTDTGCTILLCTHILSDVERVANRAGILHKGVLAAEGTIQELIDSYRSESIELILSDPCEKNIALIREADFVRNLNYYKQSGLIVIDVNKAETDMIKLMGLLSEKQISVRSAGISAPTLEQVYIDIVSR